MSREEFLIQDQENADKVCSFLRYEKVSSVDGTNLLTSEYDFEISPEFRIQFSGHFRKNKHYTIVENSEQFSEMKQHILDFDIIALDCEATGLKVLSDQVIGISVSGLEGVGFYLPILCYSVAEQKLIRQPFADKIPEIMAILLLKKLVTWNGSYDIRIIRNNLGIDLTEALYAEVMLLKHTLIEEGFFALKDTAVQFSEEIGFDAKKLANEEQIELKGNVLENGGVWKKENKEMYKADLAILGKYACADTDLTLRLYNLFQKKLETENLVDFFYKEEVMPLYREVTIPMESFGVLLDLPKIEKNDMEITKDISRIEREILDNLLGKPEVQDWIDEKCMLKYPAKKSGKFAQKLAEMYDLPLMRSEKTGKFTFSKKSRESLTMGIFKDFLECGEEKLLPQELVTKLSRELWLDDFGEFLNISSRDQLKGLIFGKFGVKAKYLTPTKKPKLDEDIIQELADEYKWDWLVQLSTYNKLVKIKGTYIDRFLENHVDGKFYFYYKQHGTISGRYSSDAQQLPRPKEEGELPEIVLRYSNEIRSFFIAGEGENFIDCDYESLEPHTFAHVSTDEGLRNIFRKGHDFYSTIAIATEKLDNVSADKKAVDYLGKIDKPRRQKAKSYCLGVPYGMEGFALGKTLEVTTKDAEVLIRGYLDAYPDLEKWMIDSNNQAKYKGFVKSEAGRVRHLPQVKEIFAAHRNNIMHYGYRKNLQKSIGKDEAIKMYRDYKNGLNNAKNFQIQSLAASIVNRAAIAVTRELKRQGISGQVISQIHDQLIFSVGEKDTEKAKEIIRECMENTTKLSLDLKAPPEIAKTWKDGH